LHHWVSLSYRRHIHKQDTQTQKTVEEEQTTHLQHNLGSIKRNEVEKNASSLMTNGSGNIKKKCRENKRTNKENHKNI